MSAIQRIAREESKLEMTPMIDVTFLLLIFFLCTLEFRTLEGKLAAYLPKDVGVNPERASEPTEPIRIRVELAREGTHLDARDATRRRSLDPRRVALWSGSGRFVFADDRELTLHVGPLAVADLDGLEARLVSLHAADPNRAVELDVRAGVVQQDVIRVVDRLLLAGFDDVTFTGGFER